MNSSPSPRRTGPLCSLFCILILALTGCSASTGSGGLEEGGARFPNVTEVEISPEGDGAYTFDVTISSPYDSAERYADGWRVLGEDGEEYATMELGHDHASEQPFTRSQSGVQIPDGVTTVEIEGHDTANGYGGDTVTVEVPTR